ncbi:MAG: hypothetical protein U5O39_11975 [Gammaproteobacteria bacterium]|nr:hypothetical protein [Gammaproteobacteria bacterium]
MPRGIWSRSIHVAGWYQRGKPIRFVKGCEAVLEEIDFDFNAEYVAEEPRLPCSAQPNRPTNAREIGGTTRRPLLRRPRIARRDRIYKLLTNGQVKGTVGGRQ